MIAILIEFLTYFLNIIVFKRLQICEYNIYYIICIIIVSIDIIRSLLVI